MWSTGLIDNYEMTYRELCPIVRRHDPYGISAAIVNNLVSDLVCAPGWLKRCMFGPAPRAFIRTSNLAGRTRSDNKISGLSSFSIIYSIGSLGNLKKDSLEYLNSSGSSRA